MNMYLLADLIFIVVALLGAAFLGFVLGRRSLRQRFARVQTQEQEQQRVLSEAQAQLKRSKDRRTALQRELSEVRTHLSASAIDAPRTRTTVATEKVGVEANASAASERRGSTRNAHPVTRNPTPPPRASRPAAKPASRQDEALARVRARAAKIDLSHLGTAEANQRDDLMQIDSIGIFTQKKLNVLGIYTIEQIANFRTEDEQRINAAIEFPPGRIARDQWGTQAQRLRG